MPARAVDIVTGSDIYIWDYTNPKEALRDRDMACPLCDREMRVAQGMLKKPYFFHLTTCHHDWEIHPESEVHIELKRYIAQTLPRMVDEYSGASYQIEVPIEGCKRIADVLFTLRDGRRIVHEIQLSPITIDVLNARTDDYQSVGLEVYWWFGLNANNESSTSWSLERFRLHLSIDVYAEENQHDFTSGIERGEFEIEGMPIAEDIPLWM